MKWGRMGDLVFFLFLVWFENFWVVCGFEGFFVR